VYGFYQTLRLPSRPSFPVFFFSVEGSFLIFLLSGGGEGFFPHFSESSDPAPPPEARSKARSPLLEEWALSPLVTGPELLRPGFQHCGTRFFFTASRVVQRRSPGFFLPFCIPFVLRPRHATENPLSRFARARRGLLRLPAGPPFPSAGGSVCGRGECSGDPQLFIPLSARGDFSPQNQSRAGSLSLPFSDQFFPSSGHC